MKKTTLGLWVSLAMLGACSDHAQQPPTQAQVELLQAQQQLLMLQTIQRQQDVALDSLRHSSLTTSCAISNKCVVEIHQYPRY